MKQARMRHKKNHKCKAKLFDLLCDSLLVRYCIGVVFCFVLFFSFMFFLAAVVNLIALKEPSKALITRTRPFQKENWNDLFCLIRYQKSILISYCCNAFVLMVHSLFYTADLEDKKRWIWVTSAMTGLSNRLASCFEMFCPQCFGILSRKWGKNWPFNLTSSTRVCVSL